MIVRALIVLWILLVLATATTITIAFVVDIAKQYAGSNPRHGRSMLRIKQSGSNSDLKSAADAVFNYATINNKDTP